MKRLTIQLLLSCSVAMRAVSFSVLLYASYAYAQVPATTETHQPRKFDILGLKPGISNEERARLVGAKGWRCMRNFGPMIGSGALKCDTELGQLNLRLAEHLPGQPLIFLRLFFESADTNENIAQSISEQYGATPTAVRGSQGQIIEYRWSLTSTLLLTLTLSPYDNARDLTLVDAEIEAKNNEAKQADRLQQKPTPRF